MKIIFLLMFRLHLCHVKSLLLPSPRLRTYERFLNCKLQASNDSFQKVSLPEVGGSLLGEEWKARMMLLTVSAFYGSNFGFVKLLDESLFPSFAALFRFFLAGIVFLPFSMGSNVSKATLLAAVECGLFNFVGYYSQAKALQTASASTVAFIW
jgi:hypothetical protein